MEFMDQWGWDAKCVSVWGGGREKPFPASAWHAGPLLWLTQPAGEVAQGLLTWAVSGWDGVLSPRKVGALFALGYNALFSEA